jgi:hypothetical protein
MPTHYPPPQISEFHGPNPVSLSSPHLTESQKRGWGRNQHIPSSIWREGKQYFSLRYLASAWSVPRGIVARWAKARPHLVALYTDRYIYCLDQPKGEKPRLNGRNTHVPTAITRDGVRYYSMPELARRRGTSPHTTRAWVKRHPHLALQVGKHFYCQDLEFGRPHRTAPCIERDGLTYWHIPELGRRYGVSERAVRRWAAKHPHLTIREEGHLFARDEEFDPGSRAVSSIQHEGFVYYSLRELARRRGISLENVRAWAARRPHLVHREGKYIFARDEEYHPRRRPIPSAPEPPIWLKTLAARRARIHAQ